MLWYYSINVCVFYKILYLSCYSIVIMQTFSYTFQPKTFINFNQTTILISLVEMMADILVNCNFICHNLISGSWSSCQRRMAQIICDWNHATSPSSNTTVSMSWPFQPWPFTSLSKLSRTSFVAEENRRKKSRKRNPNKKPV